MENAENGGEQQQQQQQRDPLLNARDRLFHTLFFRVALGYARYQKSTQIFVGGVFVFEPIRQILTRRCIRDKLDLAIGRSRSQSLEVCKHSNSQRLPPFLRVRGYIKFLTYFNQM